MRYFTILFFLFVLFIGCGDRREGTFESGDPQSNNRTDSIPASPGAAFVDSIKEAHHASDFFTHQAVAFDVNLSFGGKSRLSATITMLTNSTKVMVTRDDGAKVLFDGTNVYRYPADTNWPRARFDVLTWMYFFAAPYKMDDPGTEIEFLGRLPLNPDTCQAGRLTFGKGIGDAPDDWYIVYTSDSTNLVRAMAYIVTFGKSEEESKEAEPHAIVYSDHREVEGIPFAHRWIFMDWNRDEGVSGERGRAEISNIRFVENAEFVLPERKIEVGM